MKILSLHSVCLLILNEKCSFFDLGTLVALVDLLFVFFLVPESLPERLRADQKISWTSIDPFAVCLPINFRLEMIDLIFISIGTAKYYS